MSSQAVGARYPNKKKDKSKKKDEKIKLEPNEYEKRFGTAGIRGQLYEIRLATWLLYTGLKRVALNTMDDFKLATNMDKAGSFDDVIFQICKDEAWMTYLLQAKHKESKHPLTMDMLLEPIQNKDFYLNDYLACYKMIKDNLDKHFMIGMESKIENCEFIIFSNIKYIHAPIDKGIEEIEVNRNDLLYLRAQQKYYTVQEFGVGKNRVIDALRRPTSFNSIIDMLTELIYDDKDALNLHKKPIEYYTHPILEHIIEIKSPVIEGVVKIKPKWGFREDFLNFSDKRKKEYDELKKNPNLQPVEENLDFKMDFLKMGLKKYKTKFDDKDPTEAEFLEHMRSKVFTVFKRDMQNLKTELREASEEIIRDTTSKEIFYYKTLPILLNIKFVTEFLGKLRLFFDQPNERELGEILKKKILNRFKLSDSDANLVFNDVSNRLQKWWLDEKKFLTKEDDFFVTAKENLSTLRLLGLVVSQHEHIKDLGFAFEDKIIDDFNDIITKYNVLLVEAKKDLSILTTSKMYQALEKENSVYKSNSLEYDYKYMLLSLSSAVSMPEVLVSFNSAKYNLLVLEVEPDSDPNLHDFFNGIKKILESNPGKKVILISEEDNPQAHSFHEHFKDLNFERYKDPDTSFADLHPDSQGLLCKKWKIVFQGIEIDLGDIVEDDDEIKKLIDSSYLLKFMRNQDVTVGVPLPRVEDQLI